MCMFIMTLAACQLAMLCQLADQDRSQPLLQVRGKVVDYNMQPLEGVSIVTTFVHDPTYQSMVTKTNTDGKFNIESEPNDSGSLQVFFHKPGYACDYSESYEPNRKPFVVQLEPEIPVPVRVIDNNGKPISGASVFPCEVEFNNEFTIGRFDDRSIAEFEMASVTDASGKATIHGVRPKMLWSLCVKVPGHAPSYFRVRNDLESERELDEAIELVWQPFSGKLKCQVTEANGKPASDAYLVVVSKEEEWNVLSVNKPIPYTSILRKLDDQGCAELDLASKLVEVKAYSFQRGISESFGFLKIKHGETTQAQFQLPATSHIIVPVIDLSTPQGAGHPGLTVTLRNKSGRVYNFASGVTNEDGIAEIEVTPGEWTFSNIRGKIPSGLAFDGIQFKVTASETEELVTAPPITLRAGRVVTGTITGVDCAALRYDFVFATYQSGEQEKEVEGKLDEHGYFSVTLPAEIEESQITNFEITDSPKTNRRSLAIKSRKPWKLEWVADEVGGMGIVLGLNDTGKLCIEKISPNSPASFCRQLSVGAQLMSFSDDSHSKTELNGLSIAEAEAMLQGPIGSRLTIRIMPNGTENQDAISISLRRGRVVAK